MVDDKQKDQTQAESADKTVAGAKPKSNLLKYIVFSAAGLVVIIGIAFGVSILLKDSPKADSEPTTSVEQTESPKETTEKESPTETSKDESLKEPAKHAETATDEEVPEDEIELDEFDQNAIDKIVENLAFLDYKPDESEIADVDLLSVEDSLEQMNWIEKEKAEIETRKAELDKREKELNALEKSIDSKIIRIEQAESNRITQLAKLYDGMDSRAVAKLMMNLDDETVVSILPRMKSKNAALVLQLLPSQRAAVLSKKMITIADK